MLRITLAGNNEGVRVVGGVVFTDGTADAELGPNKRRFFESKGATVEDLVTADARKKPQPVSGLKKHELIKFAEREGLEIDSRLTREKLVAQIEELRQAKATAEFTAQQNVAAETFSELVAGAQAEQVVRTGPNVTGNADTGAVNNTANTAVTPNTTPTPRG